MQRNLVLHGGSSPPIHIMVKNVSKSAASYWKSIVLSEISRPPNNPAWKAPPVDTLKCNIDAVFSKRYATYDIVIRNHNGSIKLAAINHHKCLHSTTAESLAILDACLILSELKISNVIIENDCLDVISIILGLLILATGLLACD
ncbi:hypothetical protein CASFOL_001811 [Castilleja foliolosa]|uniref:RNase H type-1 domain-containing protein n=1 Tax=Castilleja foliolosa TaxID=1961234 RepID=A0ABD3ECM2_9LAMI